MIDMPSVTVLDVHEARSYLYGEEEVREVVYCPKQVGRMTFIVQCAGCNQCAGYWPGKVVWCTWEQE